MNNLFVDFDTSLELKKIKFNEDTLDAYCIGGFTETTVVKRPLISQVFDWFLQKEIYYFFTLYIKENDIFYVFNFIDVKNNKTHRLKKEKDFYKAQLNCIKAIIKIIN
jgi:hypothetical protein